MYMKAPRDHKEWIERRAQRQMKRKKKTKAAESGAAKKDQGGDAKRQKCTCPSKLALAKSFQQAFCSKFPITEQDDEPLMYEVLAESNKKAQLKD